MPITKLYSLKLTVMLTVRFSHIVRGTFRSQHKFKKVKPKRRSHNLLVKFWNRYCNKPCREIFSLLAISPLEFYTEKRKKELIVWTPPHSRDPQKCVRPKRHTTGRSIPLNSCPLHQTGLSRKQLHIFSSPFFSDSLPRWADLRGSINSYCF